MKFEDLGETKLIKCEPDSLSQFGFQHMGSVVKALPSTVDAGIGETAGWVIHDEADFHDFFKVNLGHTLATVSDSPDRQLTAVSTIDETKTDSDFQLLHKAAMEGKNGFHPMFFSYNVRPNRDEAWLEERRKENESTPWVVGKNYPRTIEEALSPISAQSCFKKEVLDRLWEDRLENPEMRQGFIYILCKPAVGTQYVAGVDVGEGVGLDYSVLTIVGKRGLSSEVVAVIYTNDVATDLFAYYAVELCREYFKPLLGIENNSLGVAVTNKVVELGYTNLYSSSAEEKKKKGIPVTGTEKVGWTTGEKNKQIALVELVDSVNNGSLITRFSPQIKELMEMQWVKGKPVPAGKTHGDTVISLMLANQMLKQAKGLFKPSLYVRGKRIF